MDDIHKVVTHHAGGETHVCSDACKTAHIRVTASVTQHSDGSYSFTIQPSDGVETLGVGMGKLACSLSMGDAIIRRACGVTTS